MNGAGAMIDYVTLLLANMSAALVVLAAFLWRGLDRPDTRYWAPAFGMPGLVATIAGFAMTFTHPIPLPYSMAYGEMSVLFGVLFWVRLGSCRRLDAASAGVLCVSVRCDGHPAGHSYHRPVIDPRPYPARTRLHFDWSVRRGCRSGALAARGSGPPHHRHPRRIGCRRHLGLDVLRSLLVSHEAILTALLTVCTGGGRGRTRGESKPYLTVASFSCQGWLLPCRLIG